MSRKRNLSSKSLLRQRIYNRIYYIRNRERILKHKKAYYLRKKAIAFVDERASKAFILWARAERV